MLAFTQCATWRLFIGQAMSFAQKMTLRFWRRLPPTRCCSNLLLLVWQHAPLLLLYSLFHHLYMSTTNTTQAPTTPNNSNKRRSARVQKRDPIIAPGFGTYKDVSNLASSLGLPVPAVQVSSYLVSLVLL